MQWSELDLYTAAQSVLQELAAPAELANVRISLEGSSARIRGIPQLVNAILFNLADNAVKYNRSGGLVSLQILSQETRVLLRISDTGIGIPQEEQGRIFERFYRVDKSHSKEMGGTGLGLSIVKHAALVLGAELTVESTPGKGTSMTVAFPK